MSVNILIEENYNGMIFENRISLNHIFGLRNKRINFNTDDYLVLIGMKLKILLI